MTDLSVRLLSWYDQHGRKDLPWRRDHDPYRIWVSEIMLQQTQVVTVIPYYQRFVKRFPTVQTLAAAPLDEVLHLWTGLGYYARGRNLHKTAKLLVDQYRGEFPREIDSMCQLPGIGRSTAGAILAFAHGQRHPILDGNVKRILTRYHRVSGWPGRRAVEQQLWALAERHTPDTRIADYTQAVMDLGATICRRADPHCVACPLRRHCAAHRCGDPHAFPTRAPQRAKPAKAVSMVMIRNSGGFLLERRPTRGIWGGLWGFPECAPGADIPAIIKARYGMSVAPEPCWEPIRHSFTHFHLHITPVPAKLLTNGCGIMETADLVWYKVHYPDERGLAAPVKFLLKKLSKTYGAQRKLYQARS